MLKATEKGTFLVQVLDQQHNSWQGTITWLASGKKKNFRSLLELITFVGSELEKNRPDESECDEEAPAGEPPIRSVRQSRRVGKKQPSRAGSGLAALETVHIEIELPQTRTG